MKTLTSKFLRSLILWATRHYSQLNHQGQLPGWNAQLPFEPGKTTVPYAGRVFESEEVEVAVASTLDFWLTLGVEGEAFEKELGAFLGVKRTLLTNSGSSANLLAISSLTSIKLPAEKRLRPGDEIITCAAGFPTTVAPILQNGLVPVFVDNNPLTGNIDVRDLEEAYRPGKTKAVMVAHALGNPFDLGAILSFCKKYNLWLVEDNCDALGCRYFIPESHPLRSQGYPADSFTGTWGDLSTQSFYPPHHLTMGEGGAVSIIRDMRLKVIVESFRDWGRDCWCASGKDNTCAKRFDWQLGELPEGYDHKYIYKHLGYNLKPLDPQAAIGRAQLKRMNSFIEARKTNWEKLRRGLKGLEHVFDFALPTHAKSWSESGFEWDESGCKTDCSWFGFMMLVKADAPFKRRDFAKYLDEKKIGNRMLFGGNLVRQPAFVDLKKENPEAFRVVGDLKGADRLMNESIFIGVYPGLSDEMIDYMVDTIQKYVKQW
ncbi:MAG: lipopolysaccharide biosynthesis protein RfbH [Verrucomicrobiota bacterium]